MGLHKQHSYSGTKTTCYVGYAASSVETRHWYLVNCFRFLSAGGDAVALYQGSSVFVVMAGALL